MRTSQSHYNAITTQTTFARNDKYVSEAHSKELDVLTTLFVSQRINRVKERGFVGRIVAE